MDFGALQNELFQMEQHIDLFTFNLLKGTETGTECTFNYIAFLIESITQVLCTWFICWMNVLY